MQHTVLGFSALFFLGACSADVDDLFGGGEGTAGGGGAQTTTATTGTTSTSGPSGPGSTTTGTTGTTSTSGPTTSSSVTTGQTTSVTTGPDPDPTASCRGAGECSVQGQGICCWDLEAQQGECQPNSEQCQASSFDQVTAIHCQLPDQCPGQVCCAHRAFPSNQSPYDVTACMSPNDCGDPNRIVCDPNAPACPGGQTCKASQLLPPGYYICSPN